MGRGSINVHAIDLNRAVRVLTVDERHLLEAFMQGYSGAELAKGLGISLTAIHTRLSRARLRIRKHMNGMAA